MDLDRGASKNSGSEGTGVLAALYTAILFSFAAIPTVVLVWTSTRFIERNYNVAFCCILAGVVFCLLPAVSKWCLMAGMLALTLINSAALGVSGPSVALVLNYVANAHKAFGFAWFNAVNSLCGLIGPLAVGLVVQWTGSYLGSMYFAGAVMCLSGVIFLVTKDFPNY